MLTFPHTWCAILYVCVLYITDVITIERTGENFRLIYDSKGRFAVHRITPEEAKVSYIGGLDKVLVSVTSRFPSLLESPGFFLNSRTWKVLEKYPWKLHVTDDISCISSTKFGQLILGKIVKIVATRCHLEAKMHQIRFWLGLPQLTALPRFPNLI